MGLSLLLNKYFFTKIRVDAHAPSNGVDDFKTKTRAQSDLKMDLIKTDEEKNQYQLTMRVKIIPVDTDSTIPYTADIEVVGFFTIPETTEKNSELEKVVKITGGSILFSAVREQLLSLTARGPFPPMQLPTINLVAVVENNNNNHPPPP